MLDPIYYAVSAVMWFWHEVFGLLLGPASGVGWALSVVFLVLTLRALMIKPFLAQMRSARAMRTLAPQMTELRARHRDDPARLATELRALQSEHGVSMLGSFLPTLLQIPVFLGLLHVLHGFNRSGLTFEQNAAIANYVFAPDEVRSFLVARLFGAPLSAYLSMSQDLLDSFGAHVDRWEVAVVALPMMLVAAVATHFTARHSAAQQQGVEGPAATVVRWMPWIFPLGALAGGLFFPFPIAILLYWLTNNVWTLAQQRLVHRRLGPLPALPPRPAPAVRAATPPRVGGRPATRRQTVAPPSPEPESAGVAAASAGAVARRGGAPPRRRRNSSGHRPSRHRR